jgi:hypothetical protein
MSPRSRDLSFLLSLAVVGCGAAVDDPNSGGTGDDGNLLDQAIDACTPWAKHYADCYNEMYASEDYNLSYVAFVGYCISYFGYAQMIGPACVDALAEYHACIAALPCEEFFDDGDGGENYPCEAEAEARGQACEGEVSEDGDIPETDAGEFGDESTTDVSESTTGEPPSTSTTQTTSASGSESSSSDDGGSGSDSTTG